MARVIRWGEVGWTGQDGINVPYRDDIPGVYSDIRYRPGNATDKSSGQFVVEGVSYAPNAMPHQVATDAAMRAKAWSDWHMLVRPGGSGFRCHPEPQYDDQQKVTITDGSYFGAKEAIRQGDGTYKIVAPGYPKNEDSRLGWVPAIRTADQLGLRPREEREDQFDPTAKLANEDDPGFRYTQDVEDDNLKGLSAKEISEKGVGVKQRLRIHVPNIFTQLTIGEATKDTHGQGFAYPGFGVKTAGHIFMAATPISGRDGPATPAMVFQSKGSASFLSETGTVFLGGGGGLHAGSGGGITLSGEGGVMLAGGIPSGAWRSVGGWWMSEIDGTTSPTVPPWMQGQGMVTGIVGRALAALDVWAGLQTSKLAKNRSFRMGLKPDEHSRLGWSEAGAGRVGVVFSAIGAASGALSALSGGYLDKIDSTASQLAAGTTIWGQAGLILASPVTIGMYSIFGTCIASKAGVSVVAADDIGINTGKALDISGDTVSILGEKKVVMFSDKHVELGALKPEGTLLMLGDRISIGLDEERKVSLPASHVHIGSKSETIIHSGARMTLNSDDSILATAKSFGVTIGNSSLDLDGSEASVSATKMVALKSNKLILRGEKVATLSSGKSVVCVAPKKVVVGVPQNPPGPLELDSEVPKKIEFKGNHWDFVMRRLEERGRIERVKRANAKKKENYEKALKESKMKNGFEVSDSKIIIKFGGVKYTFDSGKFKAPSLTSK